MLQTSTRISAPRALVASILIFAGCTSSEDTQFVNDVDPEDTGAKFASDCGVVVNGMLENPVSESAGEAVESASVISSNYVVINTGGGPQLVKLHALGATDSRLESRAVEYLRSIVGRGATFFKATEDCTVTAPGGGAGTSGQLFSAGGLNVSEALIRQGLATSVDSGTCGEEQIGFCYNALIEEIQASQPHSAGQITDFLWKPESDGGYNPGLLSILANPCNADVVVNGDHLRNYGPGNGRCTTARSVTKSGCDYGSNAKVEIFDPSSGLPYTFPDGNDFYTIPNGCSRVEFKS